MKRTLRLLLTGLLLVLSTTLQNLVVKADANLNVSNFAALQSALADPDSIINITIDASFEITALLTIPAGKTVTISSGVDGPYTLRRAAGLTGHLISVPDTSSLTLNHMILDGNKSVVNPANGSLIYATGALTLNNTDIQNNSSGNSSGVGGGITVNKGAFIMNGGRVTNNISAFWGGGIFIGTDFSTTFVISGAEISYNEANTRADASGGGIVTYGIGTITNTLITKNNATGYYGGGIINMGKLTLGAGTVISENTSNFYGGGVANQNYGGEVTINGAQITNNTAVKGGGGLFAMDYILIKSGEISDNHVTDGHGGGVFVSPVTNGTTIKAVLDMQGGVISGNDASKRAGGVYIGPGFTMNMTGGTISENTAADAGGGISNSGTLTMDDGLISENTAIAGGGIYNLNTMTINGGEISDNSATAGIGGGIYHTPSTPPQSLLINGGKIKNNHAIDGGGGIGVSADNLATVEVGADVEFSGNSIEGQAYGISAADEEAYDIAIKATKWTAPFEKGYNNVDISYISEGEEVFIVTFDIDGDKETIPQQVVKIGNKVTKPADPTKVNYVFDSWFIDSDLTTPFDFDSEVITDTTLYAKWKQYVLLTVISNGVVIKSEDVEVGTYLTVPTAPVRPGYTFTGWFSDLDCTTPYDFGTEVSSPIILYAGWQKEASSGGSSTPSASVANPAALDTGVRHEVHPVQPLILGLCMLYFVVKYMLEKKFSNREVVIRKE
ncbi:MAG: InlB B-repeat-containing protein [Erysipelotrichaceae bacterium]|jgi:uncharacterized repeat protein (TIGR02543 family)|nr:InlB B-repeat-containing protein [Erysipelotrichaceae bacterium]